MIRLLAPAKLNLYLRVLGRRADGYHELETLFERIDLADELSFEPADVLSLTCDDLSAVPGTAQAGPTLSVGPDNLILKAAQLLRTHTGTTQGARIRLAKRIPVAAGLGGGSSDAATTLLGLNQLWGLGLAPDTLDTLAKQLGADVLVFLMAEPFAIGRGRGDACEPLPCRRQLSHVLVTPPEQLSTRDVFEGFDRHQAEFALTPPPTVGTPAEKNSWWGGLTAPKPSLTMVVHALSNGSLGELADGLWNDLEPEAIRRCPSSGLILSRLRDLGCLGVRLSGSGPSVFGLCSDLQQAQEVAAQVRGRAAPSWRVEIVRTMHHVGAWP